MRNDLKTEERCSTTARPGYTNPPPAGRFVPPPRLTDSFFLSEFWPGLAVARIRYPCHNTPCFETGGLHSHAAERACPSSSCCSQPAGCPSPGLVAEGDCA